MANTRVATLLHVLAALAGAALVVQVAATPLIHDDLFWHLRTGELIAETGSVPVTDPFSHTLPGARWITHEWGFAVITHAVYRLGGYVGLIHLQQLLVLLVFATVYAVMRRASARPGSFLLVPMLLLGLAASARPLPIMRAALFSTLFLALLSYLLARVHAARTFGNQLALAALFLVWANVHVGVVFGLAVLGLHGLQAAFEQWRRHPEQRWSAPFRGVSSRHALLVLACSALTLVNVNGFDLWRFPFHLNDVLYNSGLRWNMGHYTSPALDAYPGFYALLALCLAACLPLRSLLETLRDERAPRIAQLASALLFLALSARSSRFIPDFVVFALPFCAARFGRIEPRLEAAPVLPHGASAAAALACLALFSRPFPAAPLSPFLPSNAVAFMQREDIRGRMFNPENLGGFVGWHARVPVYWDGRNDVFGGALAKQFAEADDKLALMDAHDVDVLVLDQMYHRGFEPHLLRRRDRWGLVYFDALVALYVKRVPRFERVLARWEYALLRAFGLPSEAELARIERVPQARARLDLEVARLIEQDAASFGGFYLRGLLAETRGDLPAAYAAFERVLAIEEDAEVLYRLGRVAHALGRDAEARVFVARALALAPR